MGTSKEQLATIATQAGLNFGRMPDGNLMMTFTTEHGRFQIGVTVESTGGFYQVRSLGLGGCSATSPNVPAVLRRLNSINATHKSVKFVWDETSGEIIGYADVLLTDVELTLPLFMTTLRFLVAALDEQCGEIAAAASGMTSTTTADDDGLARLMQAMGDPGAGKA